MLLSGWLPVHLTPTLHCTVLCNTTMSLYTTVQQPCHCTVQPYTTLLLPDMMRKVGWTWAGLDGMYWKNFLRSLAERMEYYIDTHDLIAN